MVHDMFELVVDREWSVVVLVCMPWFWTHEVCGVYEYTQDSVDDMFCHEFWVPVRPAQNCAGVGVIFCMSYYLMSL